MASYNRVVVAGNLTRDVEIRQTPQGTAVTEIGLAVNERVKSGDQWEDVVNFFDVTLWGRTAEVANEYLGKGSSVLIEGKLRQDRWEQDGQKRSKVKINGERLVMLGSKNEHDQSQSPRQERAEQQQAPQGLPPNDEVPF